MIDDVFEEGDPFTDPSWQSGKAIKKRADRFIGCPVAWFAYVLPLVRSKEQLVLALYLYRRCCICRSDTVSVPSADLEELGIGRWGKRRLLIPLEQAGVITMGERNGRTAKVRLNHWPDPPS